MPEPFILDGDSHACRLELESFVGRDGQLVADATSMSSRGGRPPGGSRR